MMKSVMKWAVLAVILLFSVPLVSGFTVSSVSIEPSGALEPGKTVTVSYRLQFPASGGETFPSQSELQMSTDLEKPTWSWVLILDQIENPRPSAGGKVLSLSGFELSYPGSVDQSIRVTMEGTVPSVDATGEKTIIRIQEVDKNGNVLTSSKVEHKATVVNKGDLQKEINAKKTALQTFRAHIDEKAAIGVDTAAAEIKYNDANSKIAAAEQLPATQYSAALEYLNTATQLITDGETALDRAWAESEVINAQTPITNADKVIGWFMGNTSTAKESRLQPILSKREIAVSYLSTANDEITKGNYAQARSKAVEAYAKGNETYTDALKLQAEVNDGFNPIAWITGLFKNGIIVIIVGVVLVVLVAVGVIIYRKRSSWDELG